MGSKGDYCDVDRNVDPVPVGPYKYRVSTVSPKYFSTEKASYSGYLTTKLVK